MPTTPARVSTTDTRRAGGTTIPAQITITTATMTKSSRVATPNVKTAASAATRRREGVAASSTRPAASAVDATVRKVTRPTSMPRNVQNNNGYVRPTASTASGGAARLDGTSRSTRIAAPRAVATINTTPASMTASAADDPWSPMACSAAMNSVHNGFETPSTRGAPSNHTKPPPRANVRPYVIQIIASSNSVNRRCPPLVQLDRTMKTPQNNTDGTSASVVRRRSMPHVAAGASRDGKALGTSVSTLVTRRGSYSINAEFRPALRPSAGQHR